MLTTDEVYRRAIRILRVLRHESDCFHIDVIAIQVMVAARVTLCRHLNLYKFSHDSYSPCFGVAHAPGKRCVCIAVHARKWQGAECWLASIEILDHQRRFGSIRPGRRAVSSFETTNRRRKWSVRILYQVGEETLGPTAAVKKRSLLYSRSGPFPFPISVPSL
jgi:hypothetical protein